LISISFNMRDLDWLLLEHFGVPRAEARYPRTVGDLAGAGERTAPLPPFVKKK
jgi:hypothetical protein